MRQVVGCLVALALVSGGAGVSAATYQVEKVASGFQFTEGPAWSPRGTLLFSDIPANKIYEIDTASGQKASRSIDAKVYREPTGNSNGLTFDREGRLIVCEHSGRRVSRSTRVGSASPDDGPGSDTPDQRLEVLADRYEGKRLNSPNDVVVKSDGSIYFTDPTYGIKKEEHELGFQGVYRIKPDGKLELLVNDFKMPNGLCFSPDEKRLYIADSSELRHIRVFDVAKDGTLTGGAVFATVDPTGVPDGIKVDPVGNLYVTGPGGVWIFDPSGKHIDTIPVPETPANIGWGDPDGKALYITARTSIYKVRPLAANARRAMLSCETYSLRDYFGAGKLDFLTVPKTLKDMGIPGITYNDIWMKSYDKPYLDQIKKACADAGIKITGFICEGNMATLDDAAWNKQIEINADKMKAAAYLGAPIVRLNLGGLGDEQKDDTIGAQRCIDAFKKLLPLAKGLNIKMTIENHGGVSKKADTILKVIKGSDPEWVGSCLDFGNWPDADRYTETTKLAPYAYHVHAKTHAFNQQGEDINKDYKRLLQIVKDAKFDRAVSIEYEGTEDQIVGVKKTRDLILRYWPELGR